MGQGAKRALKAGVLVPPTIRLPSSVRRCPTRMQPWVSSAVLPLWIRMPVKPGTPSSRGRMRPKRGLTTSMRTR